MEEKSLNILYVEDDEGDRRLAKEAFQKLNLKSNLFTVISGEEAIGFLYRQGPFVQVVSPDIIILDLNLPKISGIDLLIRIKSDPILTKIPIAILTGSMGHKNIVQDHNPKTHRYFQKPVDFDGFIKTMKKIERFCLETVQVENRE